MLRDNGGPDAEARAEGLAAGSEVRVGLEAWHADDPDDPDLRILLAVRRLDSLAWLAIQDDVDPEVLWCDAVESLWRTVELLQPVLDQPAHARPARVWSAVAVGQLVIRRQAPARDFERCAADAEVAGGDGGEVASVQLLRARIRATDPTADDAPGVQLAEQVAATLPPGDPRHAEVVSAHVERYLAANDRDQAAGRDYWLDDAVVGSLLAAAERFGDGDDGPASFDAHALLAFGLARTPERRLARRHFDRLDRRVSTWPWAVMADPAGAYAELATSARGRPSWLPRRTALRR